MSNCKKYSKGVKRIFKSIDYDYKLLNGGDDVSNKTTVIANVYMKKEYSIGLLTLKFIIIHLFI